MMEDVIKTIKAQLYDRATSPLSGAFIISWCLCNWRVIFILFSDMLVDEKFIYIDTKIFISLSDFILNSMIYPFIATLLIIFFYPWPARFVYEYSRVQQRKLKEIQQKIEDEEPLTKEQAREIKANATEKESRFESTLNRKDEKIQVLENLNKELQKQNETNEGLIETGKNDIKKQAEKIEELEVDINKLHELNKSNEEKNESVINERNKQLKKRIEELEESNKALQLELDKGRNPKLKGLLGNSEIISKSINSRNVSNEGIATSSRNSIKANLSSDETNTVSKAIGPLKPTAIYSAAKEASRKFGSLLGSEAEKIAMSEFEKSKNSRFGYQGVEEASRKFGSYLGSEAEKIAMSELEKYKNSRFGYPGVEEASRKFGFQVGSEAEKIAMSELQELENQKKR